ncbi:helix-turn-helix domain-containing protein [Actinomadura sp. SCN-SB]|uniref:arsenate reductase/protein-tyrosine-phosphatase family protein n=1 Tax=Actinomadura sp. SCN-SB TaxID=3373092 RepID=UPI003753C6D6
MNVEVSSSLESRARVHAALGEPARLAVVDALLLGDASPSELSALLEMPSNLLAHHLKVLTEAGVVRRRRSEADRRRWYVQLVPEAMAVVSVRGSGPPRAERVVFVCTRNSARSRMAAALWTARSAVPATSAGTEPGPGAHRRAVRVARRHGLVLDERVARHVRRVTRPDDLVVAVCDNAYEHPDAYSPGPSPQLHWSVPDPAPVDTDAAFEDAFADLQARVDRLTELMNTDQPPS